MTHELVERNEWVVSAHCPDTVFDSLLSLILYKFREKGKSQSHNVKDKVLQMFKLNWKF